MINNSVRWKKDKALSHNKLFTFIIGQRGVGKTFQFKKWAIDDFLRHKKRTAWVMRYAKELDAATDKGKFFEDILNLYPNYEFRIEKGNGFIRENDGLGDQSQIPWERFISFKALSEVSLKAISDPTVNKIIFDEFLPLPGIRYLKNEVERFLEYYFTIFRQGDGRAFFLGNNITIASPYFSYLNVKPPREGEIIDYPEICIENVKNDAYKNAMHETRFGRLVRGTHYEQYAIENESLINLTAFVMPRPRGAVCYVQIATQMGPLYLWIAKPHSIFISLRGDPNVSTWAVDESSHTEKSEYIGFAGHLAKNLIKSNYAVGTLFFDSEEAKARFIATCGGLLK